MESKSVFKSKTFWVNTVALIASIGGTMGFGFGPELQADVVAGIMAAVNIGLRFVTKQPVELK